MSYVRAAFEAERESVEQLIDEAISGMFTPRRGGKELHAAMLVKKRLAQGEPCYLARIEGGTVIYEKIVGVTI